MIDSTSEITPILERGSDVTIKKIAWGWRGHIPFGYVTLLFGEPGVGKSLITHDLVARVTTGSKWPDGQRGSKPASVIYINAEEGSGDVIVPRVKFAGGDLSRLFIWKGNRVRTDERTEERDVDLVADIPILRRMIKEQSNVRWLVVDPLTAYLPKEHGDSFKDTDVRRMLLPLTKMAEELKIAVIGVMHVNKSTTQSIIYRASGSMSFMNLARAAYAVALNPKDKQQHLFMNPKQSHALKSKTRVFAPEPSEDGELVRVKWDADTLDVTAEDVFAPQSPQSKNSDRGYGDAQREAVAFLRTKLADGPKPAKDVDDEAAAFMISKASLRRARNILRVMTTKKGVGGPWILELPAEEREPKRQPPSGNFGKLQLAPGASPNVS